VTYVVRRGQEGVGPRGEAIDGEEGTVDEDRVVETIGAKEGNELKCLS